MAKKVKKGLRFTLGDMKRKYNALKMQNFEMCLISDVVNDIYKIERDRRIPLEEL